MARLTPRQAALLKEKLRAVRERGEIYRFAPPESDPAQWPAGAQRAPEVLQGFWRDVSSGDFVDRPGSVRPLSVLASEMSAETGVPADESAAFPGGWAVFKLRDGAALVLSEDGAMWRTPSPKEQQAGRKALPLKKKSGKPMGFVEWLDGLLAEALTTVPTLVSQGNDEFRLNAPVQSLPDEWLSESSLTSLILNATQLSELPPRIGELSRLQQLIVDGPLESLPASLAQLSQLATVRLSNTRLTRLPDWFAGLEALELLEVHSSPVESVPSDLFALGRLRSVNLTKLALGSLPKQIEASPALEDLCLKSLPLEELPEDLSRLPLTKLVCSSLPAKRVPPLPSSLAELEISELPLADRSLARPLADMGALHTLVLRGLRPNVMRMPVLPALKTLRLYRCGLTELPAEVEKLETLVTLCLDENPLESLPDWVFSLPALQSIYLFNTHFPEEVIARYRENHPRVTVHWSAPRKVGGA
ncbi:MAG: leucine-rich repeat domain-containing protein [Polyangiaceae bacterium]|nr:leucine-rich repeat domain-containing protein [Polyangiaceae bacterium]